VGSGTEHPQVRLDGVGLGRGGGESRSPGAVCCSAFNRPFRLASRAWEKKNLLADSRGFRGARPRFDFAKNRMISVERAVTILWPPRR